jgi:hypothetical protein
MSNIKLSIGLPMYRSDVIGWLALESLCNQRDVEFEWEMLIIEEKEECFGKERLQEYIPRLQEKKCVRVEHEFIDQWVPLCKKWRMLGSKTSQTSIGFLLQAADCYSQPYRLKETHDLFLKGADWVKSPNGFFYNAISGKTVVYCGKSRTDLNMAIRTSIVRQLPNADKKSSVDAWLYDSSMAIKRKPLVVLNNNSEHWKLGVDVDGLNNISSKRAEFIRQLHYPFCKSIEKIDQYIPKPIMDRLLAFKGKNIKRKYV